MYTMLKINNGSYKYKNVDTKCDADIFFNRIHWCAIVYIVHVVLVLCQGYIPEKVVQIKHKIPI
jgi:hypothetical protein